MTDQYGAAYGAPAAVPQGEGGVYGGGYGWPQPGPPPKLSTAGATALIAVAVVCLGTRVFAAFASIHRAMLVNDLLTGGIGSEGDAHAADQLVNVAFGAVFVGLIGLIVTLIVLRRRSAAGDPVATAIVADPAVRVANRVYMLSLIASWFLRSAFTPNPDSAPEDYLHKVMDGDWATVALQAVVIVVLVVMIVSARRAVRRARAGAGAFRY